MIASRRTHDCMRLVGAVAALVLGGCIETRFESMPGGSVETCDARWQGLWVGTDHPAADPNGETTAFQVDRNCGFTVIDQPEPGGVFKRVRVPMNYVHADGNDYLVVADRAIGELVKLPPPHGIDPLPRQSFFFARYRMRGNHVEIFQVDSAEVARRVIDGALEGSVDKTANDLHVYVRGNSAQMLELIRGKSIFEAKATLQLERSDLDIDAWERARRTATARSSR